MRKYETVYILRPDLDEAASQAAVEKIEETITSNGGTVEKIDKWGVKKLAYEIKDYSEGSYVVVNFSGENDTINALEYVYKVSDTVISSIVVRADE